MELKLEMEHIGGYEAVLDTVVSQEETLETIVPDACPDIQRIVDAGGQICLTGKNVYDGGLSVSGTVKGWVLYQPEECRELRRVAVQLPFTTQVEVPGLLGSGRCVITPCLKGMDARALNPRKMLVRADIGIAVQAFQPQEFALCSEISCEDACAVQQLNREHSACVTAVVEEKEFTFYEELRLSAGPAGRAEVLCVQAEAHCTESKVIGSKLIFKGEAVLRIRYQVEGELCSMRCPMAFSQIIEASQLGEDAECDISVCLTDLEYIPAGEDERTLNVTLELLGQAVVRDRHQITLLQDVYSTAYDMDVEQGSYTVHRLLDGAVRSQSVRELLDIGAMVKSVVDSAVTVCQVRQCREGDQLSVSADLKIDVLYMNERDQLESASRTITVSGRMDALRTDVCRCQCQCSGEVFAVPAAGGVEVRFNVEFQCVVTRPQSVRVVTGAKLGELRGSKQAGQPSVILRMASPGEELWDIAKACCTTGEQIRSANRLEGDTLPVGQMLLIPSVR